MDKGSLEFRIYKGNELLAIVDELGNTHMKGDDRELVTFGTFTEKFGGTLNELKRLELI